jgi:hypothetical protein
MRSYNPEFPVLRRQDYRLHHRPCCCSFRRTGQWTSRSRHLSPVSDSGRISWLRWHAHRSFSELCVIELYMCMVSSSNRSILISYQRLLMKLSYNSLTQMETVFELGWKRYWSYYDVGIPKHFHSRNVMAVTMVTPINIFDDTEPKSCISSRVGQYFIFELDSLAIIISPYFQFDRYKRWAVCPIVFVVSSKRTTRHQFLF